MKTFKCLMMVVGLLCFFAGTASAISIDAYWNPGTGNWNLPGNWDINTVPNNGGGNTYNVYIDGGDLTNSEVFLNVNVAIDNLSISSGDILHINNNSYLTMGLANGVITNNGTITMDSAGAWTHLRLDAGDVLLTGNGTLIMGGTHALNSIRSFVNSNYRLTNDTNHTIQGHGYIGYGSMALTNKGKIKANQSVPLYVQPSNSGAINSGIMEADGGTLILYTNLFDNTNGTIQALNDSKVQICHAHVKGGLLTTSGNGVIEAYDWGKLEGVTNTGTYKTPNSYETYLVGTITNNGTMTAESTGSWTHYRLDNGDVLLTGNGTLIMGGTHGSNAIRSFVNSNNRLTNDTNHTIQGHGHMGYGAMALTNNGKIIANNPSISLAIQPSSAGAINNNLLQANGGTLILYTNLFDNTNGTIQALNDSKVQICHAHVKGGLLTTSGNGVIEAYDWGKLEGVTNTGTYKTPNSYETYLVGTITNNGTMTAESTGSWTHYRLDNGDVLLTGNGTLIMGGTHGSNAIRSFVNSNNRLTNDTNHTIQGHGHMGYDKMALTNKGMIKANHTIDLTIDPSNAGFTNLGTLRAEMGSTLNVTSNFTNFSGNTLSQGTYYVAGTMKLPVTGIATNDARIVLDGPASQLNKYSDNKDALKNFTTNAAGGDFTIMNGRNFTTVGDFSNAGKMTFDFGSTFTVGPTGTNNYFQTGGMTTVNGIFDVGLAHIQAGILGGFGTVDGNVNMGGFMQPGTSAGTFTIIGDYVQFAGGNLDIEIKKLSEFDQLFATNTNLSGTLNISLLPGYTINNGNEFEIVHWSGGRTGQFDTINGLDPQGAVSFGYEYRTNGLWLTAHVTQGVPEPTTMMLLLGGLLSIGIARRLTRKG